MTPHILSHLRHPAIALALALSAWQTVALADPADDRVEVRVHLPAAPASSDSMARRSIARLDRAALVACGGSEQSLAQVKAAVRQSACWHRAMADAVDQSADAGLRAWWAAHPS